MAGHEDDTIIALESFIHATRDSGYRGTASAVAELVDNSLQAQARTIEIGICEESANNLLLYVLDDGTGMDTRTLRTALRFGGSTRFDDRSGLGRYGMGLPNSSVSQARRVDVFTWAKLGAVLTSYLDVDEIAAGKLRVIPSPKRGKIPSALPQPKSETGTLVVWTRCDRLDNRRTSTLARKLAIALGRVFRHYLWDGIKITINGTLVVPVDPLHIRRQEVGACARLVGEPIEYKLDPPPGSASRQRGLVTVTFSELPVHEWHALPNDEKRRIGIANGAGVSVVRAKREIDYGWFFMGGKRRENYDDWWRCEVRFDPILDEAFGITHTKQQVHPQDYLQEILAPDIEQMAKVLNSRVRQSHLQLKTEIQVREVEQLANERDRLLKPLPRAKPDREQDDLVQKLQKRHPSLDLAGAAGSVAGVKYHIVEERLRNTPFFWFVRKSDHLVLVLNPEHPFHKKVYAPLMEQDTPANRQLRSQLDLMMLAAARAEASASGKDRETLEEHRKRWSDFVATFLNG